MKTTGVIPRNSVVRLMAGQETVISLLINGLSSLVL